MIVGVPREIKPGEQRVALTPAGARALSEAGHGVVVERGAGLGSGIGDEEYAAAGAALDAVERVWASADLVLKVTNSYNIAQVTARADLLIGAVLIAGARAPVLVPRSLVERMKPGSVIVDVAVDQGGSIETIHPTTLLEPVYQIAGVIHYGVANMPALVPRTSTFALTNATLPYVLELAGRGVAAAVRADPELARGANVWGGRIVHPAVAAALGEPAAALEAVLGAAA